MKHLTKVLLIVAALVVPSFARSQDHHAALNERGKQFMGFDQQKTTHHFILLKDGGTIQVTAKDAKDGASVAQIRDHLKHIAGVFAKGDFDLPALIHDTKAVPGVEGMKAHAADLVFAFEEIAAGGHVRITGRTAEAIAAVHEFLRFQIKDHKTGDPVVIR